MDALRKSVRGDAAPEKNEPSDEAKGPQLVKSRPAKHAAKHTTKPAPKRKTA
jgi:hypothetical protein